MNDVHPEDLQAFRLKARKWLAQEMDSPHPDEDLFEWGRRWQAKKYDAGWACLHWPQQYGGAGLSIKHHLIWEEEEAKYPAIFDACGLGISVCAPTLMKYMDDNQKLKHLPAIASATEVWCQLFSEPGNGSDLAGVQTRAVRSKKGWRIKGQKTWTSVAHKADYGILLARTSPDKPKHQGLTFFYVPMKDESIEVRPIKQMTGESHFNEVFIENLEIDDHHRIGPVDGGWGVALFTLMNERSYAGNQGSIRTPDTAYALQLSRDIRYRDQPAIAHGSNRRRLADLYVMEAGMQLTRGLLRRQLHKGGEPGPAYSVAKYIKGRLHHELASYCMDLQDIAGISLDSDLVPDRGFIQQSYLRTPGARLAGGSDEIQLNIIAERILGMPQEPRIDKVQPFKDIPLGPKN